MNDLYFKPLKSEKLQSGSYYGQFLIDKLKLGQGITIGNQLRRVLLGEIGGTAISAVRIVGIRHEFATIPGVREDILEILLNLKGIVIKSDTQYHTMDVQTMRVSIGNIKTKEWYTFCPNIINVAHNPKYQLIIIII